MFETLIDRRNYVEELKRKIEQKFTENNYQVFIFGSFLTEDYITNESDIDIGVYCESIAMAIEMKHFIEKELEDIQLKNDIIIMELTDDS